MDDSTKPPDSSDPRDARIAELEKQLTAALKRIAELEDLVNRLQRGGNARRPRFPRAFPNPIPRSRVARAETATARRRSFAPCPTLRRRTR